MARVITAPGIVRNVSKYLNSMRRVPFAIGKDDWTEVNSSTYTYEFITTYVTASSFDIGTFDNSVRSYAKGDISMEKKDGGGGMVFTTTKRPTGTVSGSIYIWDNNDNKVPVILEDTVIPIENGGTEATSVPGILSNLGLGSANDAQETLDFGDAVHEDVANNVTTTSEGYLLDARQGKVLKDSVDALSGKFTTIINPVNLTNNLITRVTRQYTNIVIGQDGYTNIDMIYPNMTNAFNVPYFSEATLGSMNIAGFSKGDVYGVCRGSDANKIYAIGKPNATVSFNVMYFFFNSVPTKYSDVT